jgi:hypothetical protein
MEPDRQLPTGQAELPGAGAAVAQALADSVLTRRRNAGRPAAPPIELMRTFTRCARLLDRLVITGDQRRVVQALSAIYDYEEREP